MDDTAWHGISKTPPPSSRRRGGGALGERPPSRALAGRGDALRGWRDEWAHRRLVGGRPEDRHLVALVAALHATGDAGEGPADEDEGDERDEARLIHVRALAAPRLGLSHLVSDDDLPGAPRQPRGGGGRPSPCCGVRSGAAIFSPGNGSAIASSRLTWRARQVVIRYEVREPKA